MTHKQHFLHTHNLPDGAYSLKQLSKISHVPMSILQEVYNRGIGAYNTNPSSVRLKGSYVKGVKAPMSAKLSKEQWAMARIYSFLDGNPKHDNDLRSSKRGGGPFLSRPVEPLDERVSRLVRELNQVLDTNRRDPRTGEYDPRLNDHMAELRRIVVQDELPVEIYNSYVRLSNRYAAYYDVLQAMVEARDAIKVGNLELAHERLGVLEEKNREAKMSPFHLSNWDLLVEILYRATQETTCTVCQEEYAPGSQSRVLNCGHKFHRDCWRQWVQSRDPTSTEGTCPVCRNPSGIGKPPKCRKCGGAKISGKGITFNEFKILYNKQFEPTRQLNSELLRDRIKNFKNLLLPLVSETDRPRAEEALDIMTGNYIRHENGRIGFRPEDYMRLFDILFNETKRASYEPKLTRFMN